MLAAAAALLALPAAASQPVTPAQLPKLIGSSAFVIEQAFGAPKRECSPHARRSCTYSASGRDLGVVYEGGVATEVIWFPKSKEGSISPADLGFSQNCDGPKRQPGSGGEVWSRCPGGLSVEIQNDAKGGTFLIHVATRNLLSP
jgi:hypothetical protein